EKVRAVSSEITIKIDDIRFNSSHIMGKHTVRFLPYATAKVNPENLQLCLPRKSLVKKSTTIVNAPILFNNTIPRIIEYSQLDPDTGKKTLHNFTEQEVKLHRVIDK